MKLTRTAFLFMLASGAAIAQDVNIVGNIKQSIKVPTNAHHLSAQDFEKEISFLKIELSEHAKQKIASRALKESQSNKMGLIVGKSSKIQLGMGNVPVLDQGTHGTCVTFAVTGAIDAVLNKGDYLSQLCPLQLSHYLESISYTSNAWGGSFGPIVLNQLNLFGLVSKSQQKANGCGGLSDYPLRGEDPETEMPASDYHQISEPMDPRVVTWTAVFDAYQVFDDKMDMNIAINSVKAALNAGDRVTFGVLFPDVEQGVAGAIGKFHTTNDSWILTPEIAKDINLQEPLPGHEMIITGYDDDAVAFDSHGRSYRGLFTLRNSWGSNLGDQGNFYMSYSYFKALALEADRIRHTS